MFDTMVCESDLHGNTGIFHSPNYQPTVAEIETALLSHPAVADVYVIRVTDETKDVPFIAFVKLKEYVPHFRELKWQIGWHAVAKVGACITFKDIVILDSHQDLMASLGSIMTIAKKDHDCENIHRAGYMPSTKEVECRLRSHPGVSDALVIGIPDKKNGETLIAYVTLKSRPLEPENIKWELAWQVAAEMNSRVQYTDIVIVDSLPTLQECISDNHELIQPDAQEPKGAFIQPFYWW